MDVRGRRVAAALAAAAVLLVGGCSAGESSSGSAAVAGDRAAAPLSAEKAAPAATPTGGAGATSGATAPAAPRIIAYKAQLTVTVGRDRLSSARTSALALVEQAGGYVAGETGTAVGPEGGKNGTTLTLKVPSAVHQKTLEELGLLGEQLSLTSQAEDLTQQVADVESRLKSMKASVDRVRALMADAKTLAEVVSLESELNRREADLESLQRQQQELAARGSLSTITLQLVAEHAAPAPPPVKKDKGFWASVGGALAGGWHVLVANVRGLLIGLAALAPFLLVLGPLGWLAWYLLRRRKDGEPTQPDQH